MHFHLLTYALKPPHPIANIDLPSTLPLALFPTTPDRSYRTGISDEVKWLKIANTTIVCTAWARYHSQRSHHTKKPEFFL